MVSIIPVYFIDSDIESEFISESIKNKAIPIAIPITVMASNASLINELEPINEEDSSIIEHTYYEKYCKIRLIKVKKCLCVSSFSLTTCFIMFLICPCFGPSQHSLIFL